ncbi:unnamed protein product [Thelazia callipaeda]|uniref:ditrans,polycis-polyprenyl diphosphate synthase [(2E,6E)-farnesyldiphosphate specific] n=1 Tax=Thelazia callipaeda TaxID=103827 RepID=A0A0N5CR70_THECL|nr:unnamed protein product [Thelazia callipaeda]
MEALSKLIVHCAQVGISQVTLYDPWSYISSKSSALQQLTHVLTQKTCSKRIVEIVFSDSLDTATHISPSHTLVKVMDSQDGRQSIVRACKKICTKSLPADITVEQISEYLEQEHICEPDFLLHIGDLDTMAGYSPWVLRITEILRLEDLSGNFSYQQFLSYLHNYSSRDRRIGR